MAQIDIIKAYVIEHAIRWLAAVAIILAGIIVSRLSRRWLAAALNRSRIKDDLLLKNFFLRAFSLTIAIATLLAALANLDVEVISIVAGLGVTGLILGFALRDTLSNFAAGLLLLIYRPFRAGHFIEVETAQGVVEELTIVNMQMTTTDGVRVILPNAKVWGSKIVNYSLSKQRRFELVLKVREDDVESAISAIEAATSGDPRILSSPRPLVRVTSIADGAASLSVWVWTNPEDFQSVSSDGYLRVLDQLRRAELQIL